MEIRIPDFSDGYRVLEIMPSMMADIAISSMNSNCGGRDHGAVYIERQVMNWCKQIFDFPDTAGGLLTSGTSNSTLLALQVGMFRKLGLDHKNKGFFNVCTPLRCYASVEGHSSIIKAVQTCGIGSDNLIVIPTDDKNRIFPRDSKTTYRRRYCAWLYSIYGHCQCGHR